MHISPWMQKCQRMKWNENVPEKDQEQRKDNVFVPPSHIALCMHVVECKNAKEWMTQRLWLRFLPPPSKSHLNLNSAIEEVEGRYIVYKRLVFAILPWVSSMALAETVPDRRLWRSNMLIFIASWLLSCDTAARRTGGESRWESLTFPL
jgi:hypothetical protein